MMGTEPRAGVVRFGVEVVFEAEHAVATVRAAPTLMKYATSVSRVGHGRANAAPGIGIACDEVPQGDGIAHLCAGLRGCDVLDRKGRKCLTQRFRADQRTGRGGQDQGLLEHRPVTPVGDASR